MFEFNRLTIIAGPCSLENQDMCMKVAEFAANATSDLGLDFVFKGSFCINTINATTFSTFIVDSIFLQPFGCKTPLVNDLVSGVNALPISI